MRVTNSSLLGARVPYSLNSEQELSLNQRLAKWQFIALDVNRNGVGVSNNNCIINLFPFRDLKRKK